MALPILPAIGWGGAAVLGGLGLQAYGQTQVHEMKKEEMRRLKKKMLAQQKRLRKKMLAQQTKALQELENRRRLSTPKIVLIIFSIIVLIILIYLYLK